ncbi:MAG TPA: 50S ribosomal protein L29 [Deltaproteobacteria bacterium]|nr:50S ribosomal protein L29 [Deltaproteobacteria bacterium]
MKPKELRELSEEELRAKSKQLRDELFVARVKHSTGQLEDTAKMRRLRRDVARVATVLTQKFGGTQ